MAQKRKEEPILREEDISSVDLNTEMKNFLSYLENAKEIQNKTNSFLERIAISLEKIASLQKDQNQNKILTPEIVDKLENCFLENLQKEDHEFYFGLKQKEMMSEIEDILGIECYE